MSNKLFYLLQDERYTKERVLRQKALAQDAKNIELLGLEEQQFQEYAQKVIDHCEKGGRNTIPLRRAAEIGIGGGQGPVYEGKCHHILIPNTRLKAS